MQIRTFTETATLPPHEYTSEQMALVSFCPLRARVQTFACLACRGRLSAPPIDNVFTNLNKAVLNLDNLGGGGGGITSSWRAGRLAEGHARGSLISRTRPHCERHVASRKRSGGRRVSADRLNASRRRLLARLCCVLRARDVFSGAAKVAPHKKFLPRLLCSILGAHNAAALAILAASVKPISRAAAREQPASRNNGSLVRRLIARESAQLRLALFDLICRPLLEAGAAAADCRMQLARKIGAQLFICGAARLVCVLTNLTSRHGNQATLHDFLRFAVGAIWRNSSLET